MQRRLATLVLLAAGAAALPGCVVAPAYPSYPNYPSARAPRYDDDLPGPPPAPQYEVIGVAPYPGWFWISGFWSWRAGRHAWIGGHWEAPRPGYRWEPHRWEPASRGRGWREVPGQWAR